MVEQQIPYDGRLAAIEKVGKRLSTDDPLTAHDVAERLDKAALRVWNILADIERLGPEFTAEVRASRYLTNAVTEARNAITAFLGEESDRG